MRGNAKDETERKEANQQREGTQMKQFGKFTKKAKTIIIASCVAAGVLTAVLIFLLRPSTNEPPEETPSVGGRGIVATPANIDEILAQVNQPVEDGYYESRMNVDWVFPRWDEPSTTAYVENAPTNTRTVYFDLTLQDTGELIYSSPFIPVAATLENFSLDTEIPAGEYTGVVTYHLVDDDYQSITTVAVTVTLRILA